MTFSTLDEMSLGDNAPVALRAGMDPSTITTGTLVGLDVENALAQVRVGSSNPVWVPAAPWVYTPDSPVMLAKSPGDGGRITYCLGPTRPGRRIVLGTVLAVNTTSGTLRVAVLDGEVDLEFSPGTYSVGTAVKVMRGFFGIPEYVLGPQGTFVGSGGSQPGGGSGNSGTLVTKQTVIVPQWSGSYRTGYGWDRWNTERYSGRSALWQGDAYGSGRMIGLASYGDQVVNLRAQKILRATAVVYRGDNAHTNGAAVVLQPSPHGSQPSGAPTISPASAASSAPLAPGGAGVVTLPASVLDGFRTGLFKGLVTVGADYGSFAAPPARADGMALTIQYQVVQ